MSGEISAVSPSSVARTSPPTALPPDPVATAKAMIADNRSARTGINYGELLRDIDQLNAKDGAFGQQVENAIKAELGPVATKKLMNSSYSIRAKDGSTLVMARNAPSIEQYYKGTAHASLAKTPQERAAYAASDKAHYARLDKLFGDGNAKTFEGAKIQEGLNDLLSRGYTLDQVAQYKAEKAAEAKAAAEANGGPSGTQVALDLTQMALDLAGIVDPTGVADGGNAVISLGRTFSSLFSGEWKEAGGHFVNGLISVAGILPYLGDLAKAGKFGKWVQTVTDAITLAAKNPALAAKFGEALKEIRTLLNKIPQSAIDALPADAKKSLMALKTKLDNFFNVGAKAFSSGVEATAKRLGIPPEKVQALVDMHAANLAPGAKKTPLPAPSTYMTKEQIAAHLAKFDDGAVRITSRSGYDARGTIGPTPGFVMSKSDFDRIVKETGGNLAKMEQKLGLPAGYLKGDDVMIALVEKKDLKGLAVPSGNEPGANAFWLPGGVTSGGVVEAVINLPAGTPFKEILLGTSK